MATCCPLYLREKSGLAFLWFSLEVLPTMSFNSSFFAEQKTSNFNIKIKCLEFVKFYAPGVQIILSLNVVYSEELLAKSHFFPPWELRT